MEPSRDRPCAAKPFADAGSVDALLQRALAGCPEAEDALFGLGERGVRAMLARRGLRGADLDDCVQEVFVRLLGALRARSIRGDGFWNWMRPVVKHVAVDRQRGSRLHETQPLSGEEAARSDCDPVAACDHLERRAAVRAAVAQLPDPLARPCSLFYSQGRPVSDIATTLRISADAVMKRLERARRLLRPYLQSLR